MAPQGKLTLFGEPHILPSFGKVQALDGEVEVGFCKDCCYCKDKLLGLSDIQGKDFQLSQAIRQLKGQPVKASSTLAERKVEKEED